MGERHPQDGVEEGLSACERLGDELGEVESQGQRTEMGSICNIALQAYPINSMTRATLSYGQQDRRQIGLPVKCIVSPRRRLSPAHCHRPESSFQHQSRSSPRLESPSALTWPLPTQLGVCGAVPGKRLPLRQPQIPQSIVFQPSTGKARPCSPCRSPICREHEGLNFLQKYLMHQVWIACVYVKSQLLTAICMALIFAHHDTGG